MRNQISTSFVNRTYRSPAHLNEHHVQFPIPQLPISDMPKFERTKVRRSLDSNLILGSQRPSFQSVDIDIDETSTNYNRTLSLFKKKENLQQARYDNQPYPDLDVNKIELDSMNENYIVPETVIKKVKRIWTVIAEHRAKASQEVSVTPGMLVLVIRQYKSWLYIKLVENEYLNSEPNSAQMYGFIPRSCAVDLQEIITKNCNDNGLTGKPKHPRRSQITAL